jgi:bifunctional DNA-binding transcriptional regulator/antitoxin component of YhaV-PrlF toxin-antitoxin module
MKLQRQVAYKYKDKTHHKYVIILPENTVAELGWKEGQELITKIDGTQLIIDLEKVK